MSRSAEIIRNTSETKIKLFIDLDGSGASEVDTGIGFFDHMLTSFAKHGFFDLNVKVDGDLHVDSHHTIEDTGIVLGEAIKQAAGDKKGIKRYGSFVLPMDETLILCGRICQEDLILTQTSALLRTGSADLTRRWSGNFSMRYLTQVL